MVMGDSLCSIIYVLPLSRKVEDEMQLVSWYCDVDIPMKLYQKHFLFGEGCFHVVLLLFGHTKETTISVLPFVF